MAPRKAAKARSVSVESTRSRKTRSASAEAKVAATPQPTRTSRRLRSTSESSSSPLLEYVPPRRATRGGVKKSARVSSTPVRLGAISEEIAQISGDEVEQIDEELENKSQEKQIKTLESINVIPTKSGKESNEKVREALAEINVYKHQDKAEQFRIGRRVRAAREAVDAEAARLKEAEHQDESVADSEIEQTNDSIENANAEPQPATPRSAFNSILGSIGRRILSRASSFKFSPIARPFAPTPAGQPSRSEQVTEDTYKPSGNTGRSNEETQEHLQEKADQALSGMSSRKRKRVDDLTSIPSGPSGTFRLDTKYFEQDSDGSDYVTDSEDELDEAQPDPKRVRFTDPEPNVRPVDISTTASWHFQPLENEEQVRAGTHYTPDGQYTPRMLYSSEGQSTPGYMYTSNSEDTPGILYMSEAPRTPEAQYTAGIQYMPEAQSKSNAQYAPGTQSMSEGQYNPDMQYTSDAQYMPGMQYTSDAQYMPGMQYTSDAAQYTPGNQYMSEAQYTPGISYVPETQHQPAIDFKPQSAVTTVLPWAMHVSEYGLDDKLSPIKHDDFHRAKPYSGEVFRTQDDPPVGNVFDALSVLQVKNRAELSVAELQAIGQQHGVWMGPKVKPTSTNTFCVPDDSDSESDRSSVGLRTPTSSADQIMDSPKLDSAIQPDKVHKDDNIYNGHKTDKIDKADHSKKFDKIDKVNKINKENSPFEKSVIHSAEEALAKARSQAEKYKPKTPSGLRTARKVSPSPSLLQQQMSPLAAYSTPTKLRMKRKVSPTISVQSVSPPANTSPTDDERSERPKQASDSVIDPALLESDTNTKHITPSPSPSSSPPSYFTDKLRMKRKVSPSTSMQSISPPANSSPTQTQKLQRPKTANETTTDPGPFEADIFSTPSSSYSMKCPSPLNTRLVGKTQKMQEIIDYVRSLPDAEFDNQASKICDGPPIDFTDNDAFRSALKTCKIWKPPLPGLATWEGPYSGF